MDNLEDKFLDEFDQDGKTRILDLVANRILVIFLI